MNIKKIRKILGWCAIINFGLLMFSSLVFLLAHDLIYEFYQTLIPISLETYIAIMLISMLFYKALIFVFNIIPYFVLRIVDN